MDVWVDQWFRWPLEIRVTIAAFHKLPALAAVIGAQNSTDFDGCVAACAKERKAAHAAGLR